LTSTNFTTVSSRDKVALVAGWLAGGSGSDPTLTPLATRVVTTRKDHTMSQAEENADVVRLHQNTATRNGEQLDVSCCLVFELKDGRVTDGREYVYDLYAWEELWA
jgi:ketosteroid isomerase-like protein